MGGPHLHVVSRDNANGARAKSGERSVPVPAGVLVFDRYLHERDACPGARGWTSCWSTAPMRPSGGQ